MPNENKDRSETESRKKADAKPAAHAKLDPKVPATARAKALGVLAGNGSLRDAAAFAAIHVNTLLRWRKEDPEFEQEVQRAIAVGKLQHIGKLGKASQWQASAWVLERKWPEEWAKRAKPARKARDLTVRVRRVPASDSPALPPAADQPRPDGGDDSPADTPPAAGSD